MIWGFFWREELLLGRAPLLGEIQYMDERMDKQNEWMNKINEWLTQDQSKTTIMLEANKQFLQWHHWVFGYMTIQALNWFDKDWVKYKQERHKLIVFFRKLLSCCNS